MGSKAGDLSLPTRKTSNIGQALTSFQSQCSFVIACKTSAWDLRKLFNACNSALTFASAGKVGEKADRFNKDIIPDVAPKPEPTPTPPAPEPSKAWRNQYKIKAKLFGLQHEYDGDVNLKSWFDSSRSASLHACPNSSDVSE
jgi:hypothetical protein